MGWDNLQMSGSTRAKNTPHFSLDTDGLLIEATECAETARSSNLALGASVLVRRLADWFIL